MTIYYFKYCDSICHLTSSNDICVLDKNGKVLFKEKYIGWPKPFGWIKTTERHLITNENREIAKINNNSIHIEKYEWTVKQTRENSLFGERQIDSSNECNKVKFPELGQWEIANVERDVIFDGAKFIGNDSLVRGVVKLLTRRINTRHIIPIML